MASTHALFKRFDDTIKLTEAKKEELRTSRDAIREDVRAWLSDNGKGRSRFAMQGSFAMGTVVNPIENDEFDIDDGLYLEKYEDTDKTSWPACETVHGWVLSAVADKTSTPPSDKKACVRISYGHGYHVDVPVYIMSSETPYLAHKEDGWVASDAKSFAAWLNEKNDGDGQLKRLIRYLKRWKDVCNVPLKGIELTILAGEHYQAADGRDDDSTRYTVEKIISNLALSFECRKPVEPHDDLFERMSAADRETVNNAFNSLQNALTQASVAADEVSASEHLRRVFGDDFPKGNPPKNSAGYVATSAPAVLKHDGRSG